MDQPFKFESKFKPLPTSASRLAITPEDYSRQAGGAALRHCLGRKLGG